MLIGKSLSFCIKDIILGKIKEEDVTCIVAGTKVEWLSNNHLDMIDQYAKAYWKDNPLEARTVVCRLILQGKIIQPRMLGLNANNLKNGWWYEGLLSDVIKDCER